MYPLNKSNNDVLIITINDDNNNPIINDYYLFQLKKNLIEIFLRDNYIICEYLSLFFVSYMIFNI